MKSETFDVPHHLTETWLLQSFELNFRGKNNKEKKMQYYQGDILVLQDFVSVRKRKSAEKKI